MNSDMPALFNILAGTAFLQRRTVLYVCFSLNLLYVRFCCLGTEALSNKFKLRYQKDIITLGKELDMPVRIFSINVYQLIQNVIFKTLFLHISRQCDCHNFGSTGRTTLFNECTNQQRSVCQHLEIHHKPILVAFKTSCIL